MGNLEFNLATGADLEEVYEVFVSAIKTMEEQGIHQWDSLYPDKEILEEDIEKQELYIGKIDGNIAAAYVLNGECDEAYSEGKWQYPEASFNVIHRLCIHPKFQNQKLGYKTLTYIEEQLIKLGIESIRLDTFTLNPYAVRLYEKLGYKKVGIVHWRKGAFYLMEKKL